MPTFEIEAEGRQTVRVWGTFEVFAATKEDAIDKFDNHTGDHELDFELVNREIIDEEDSPEWIASDDN